MLLVRVYMLAFLALLALLAFLGGCPGGDEPASCPITASTDIMLVYADAEGAVHDLADGAAVPLVAAPQGGHIVLVAPAVHVPKSCQVEVTAALRDPVNHRVIGLEERPLMLREQQGWARPPAASGLSDLANVAVCPTTAASASIDGNPYLLELSVLDDDQRPMATRSMMIVPTCTQNYCRGDCGAL